MTEIVLSRCKPITRERKEGRFSFEVIVIHIAISADLIWSRILEYRELLESIKDYGTNEFTESADIAEIGGS